MTCSLPRFARLAALAALLTGCTDKGETSGGSSSSGSSSSGSTGDASSTSDVSTTDDSTTDVRPTTGDSSTGEQPDGMFGFTCVQLSRGEGFEDDPFVGTRKVTVTLAYGPCLMDYYIEKHPEMRQAGEVGQVVFSAWQSRLCAEDVPGVPACEVEKIEQTIDLTGFVYNSTVTYALTGDATLAGSTLLWGPGPLPMFAECEDGHTPTVELDGLASIQGLGEDDAPLWQVQSFSGLGAMGLTGDGCIEVAVAPL